MQLTGGQLFLEQLLELPLEIMRLAIDNVGGSVDKAGTTISDTVTGDCSFTT